MAEPTIREYRCELQANGLYRVSALVGQTRAVGWIQAHEPELTPYLRANLMATAARDTEAAHA